MAGVVTLGGEFLQALRRRCDDVGALLVYDEVQTGMGRLGRPFAAGEHGVMPDMITLAKGIANGVPMGALLMSPAVADKIVIGDLGSTFGGGPLACAALLAVLETIEADGLLERAAAFGREARERLAVGPVRDVIGCGCLIGLRMDGDAKPVQQQLLERGFITGTSGDAHVLRLLPAINTPIEAIEALRAVLIEMGN